MKSIFSSFLNKGTKKSYFELITDEDYYYVVKLKNEPIFYAKKREHASDLIKKLEGIYDWRKVDNLTELQQASPTTYNLIRPYLQKYGCPREFNGNYMITKSDNTVSYRLVDYSIATGEHLVEGLAIRQSDDRYHLDNVSTGRSLTFMESKELLVNFYEETKKLIPWNQKDLPSMIDTDTELRTYLKAAKNSVLNGNDIPELPVSTVSRLQFKIYGGDNEEKLTVFVEAMSKLHNMVGLNDAKSKIESFIKAYSVNKKLAARNFDIADDSLHSLFIGPPGTGKTEVARLMVDILWSLDMIEERKLIEGSKETLVKAAIGGTEEATQEVIRQARGGLLFIDEAGTLAGNTTSGEGQDYGKIAIDTIMRALDKTDENGKKIVAIFASYPKEMETLLETNPGLRSRFPFTFEFNSFTPTELITITRQKLMERHCDPKNVDSIITKLIESKAKSGSLQGNARDIRVLVEEIVRNHKVRISDSNESFGLLTEEDFSTLLNVNSVKTNEGLINLRKEGEKELAEFIGAESIKEDIQTWVNILELNQIRYEQGSEVAPPRLHMALKGNPGVGKTTLARILAKIFKGMGILSRGHLVEIQAKDLVGTHLGHTPQKVNDIVKSAMGGILFIDEFYSLIEGDNDTFGKEAIVKLMAAMENNPKDFLVIVAGYVDQMDRIFQVNPGFPSRLSEQFVLEDYTAEELSQIFTLNMNSDKLIMGTNVLETAKHYITKAKIENNADNSNGRWVRRFVDQIKKAQANRWVKEGKNQLETQLVKEDDIHRAYVKL